MKWNEITIDLSLPPEERWEVLKNFKSGMHALIDFFSGEILSLVPPELLEGLHFYAESLLDDEYISELKGISKTAEIPYTNLLTANLYYDALKIVLGCSTFAFNSESGPVHARNLDWFSKDNHLNSHSMITHFINGKNEYTTIGWPGFTGCLSGMAKNKFSITLNAVWSNDAPNAAQPVVYLIRKVLENAADFEEAVDRLSITPIASDCLLMVCGTKENEMAVIERTPTRHAIRYAENGRLFVTNDYKLIDKKEAVGANPLSETSCGRYGRMEVLTEKMDFTDENIFDVLNDPFVKMEITMQQMYFNPKTGKYKLFDNLIF